MRDWLFDKESSALLIINMQNAFVHPDGSLSKSGLDTSRTFQSVESIRMLKEAFNFKKRPIIYIQHINQGGEFITNVNENLSPISLKHDYCLEGTWDAEIISELEPSKEDFVVTKHRFSAFYHTNLNKLLCELGVNTLVVTGVATNICVESTIRDASYRDYQIYVPEEATASFSPEQELGSFINFESGFAQVIPVKDMLHEILVQVI